MNSRLVAFVSVLVSGIWTPLAFLPDCFMPSVACGYLSHMLSSCIADPQKHVRLGAAAVKQVVSEQTQPLCSKEWSCCHCRKASSPKTHVGYTAIDQYGGHHVTTIKQVTWEWTWPTTSRRQYNGTWCHCIGLLHHTGWGIEPQWAGGSSPVKYGWLDVSYLLSWYKMDY